MRARLGWLLLFLPRPMFTLTRVAALRTSDYYRGYAAGVRDQKTVAVAAERDEWDGRRQPFPCE